MRLLYPADPFNNQRPDEEYVEEFDAVNALGLACSLFSLENFSGGAFRPRPRFDADDEVIYRESLAPDTEERYFVLNGLPYGRDGMVPDLVRQIAAVIDSPFFLSTPFYPQMATYA